LENEPQLLTMNFNIGAIFCDSIWWPEVIPRVLFSPDKTVMFIPMELWTRRRGKWCKFMPNITKYVDDRKLNTRYPHTPYHLQEAFAEFQSASIKRCLVPLTIQDSVLEIPITTLDAKLYAYNMLGVRESFPNHDVASYVYCCNNIVSITKDYTGYTFAKNFPIPSDLNNIIINYVGKFHSDPIDIALMGRVCHLAVGLYQIEKNGSRKPLPNECKLSIISKHADLFNLQVLNLQPPKERDKNNKYYICEENMDYVRSDDIFILYNNPKRSHILDLIFLKPLCIDKSSQQIYLRIIIPDTIINACYKIELSIASHSLQKSIRFGGMHIYEWPN